MFERWLYLKVCYAVIWLSGAVADALYAPLRALGLWRTCLVLLRGASRVQHFLAWALLGLDLSKV